MSKELKKKIIDSLKTQGFIINGHIVPQLYDKDTFRKIQDFSRKEQIDLQAKFIENNSDVVRKYLVNGKDIDPSKISLELIQVDENTEENIIYRWWNLIWWSVPYQRAYGRQMRFLLWDKTHNAPFGLIGLQSPVLKMAVRDSYLNIPSNELDYWINMSMQAQRLGALPPYNQILGGKMTALAATSNELRKAYKQKYKDKVTIIENRKICSDLLFITTTSAFGRSSIYNRLKYNNEQVAISLGYTKGSGTFHISQNIYIDIQKFLIKNGVDVNTTFGYGPSRKLKLLDIAFNLLGLGEYTYHNIQREFFLFPLANNIQNVINKNATPKYSSRRLNEMTEYWKERWAIPRSLRMLEWKEFDANKFISVAIKSALNGEKK